MSKQDTMAAKIQKLLAKAENTTFEAERDAFVAKAQQLMSEYSITEAMIDLKAPAEREEIVEGEIEYTGIFQQATMALGWRVVVANGARGFYSNRSWAKPKKHVLYVVGFKSDVEHIKMLDASLQLQAATALKIWWKTVDSSWMSGMEKFKARREFLYGFSSGVGMKLDAAAKAAEEQVVQQTVEIEGRDTEEVTTEVGLAIRTRKEAVNDWMDTHHGTLRARSSNRSYGGVGSHAAGRTAGQAANIGQSGLSGGRVALNG